MMGPSKIPEAKWSEYKAYLHDLYITEDRTLSQVIQQVENELGFRPSKAQYIRQFKKWKFEKNLRGDQWKRIAKVVRNRRSYGKDSELLIKDERVSDRRLRKEMSRYRPQENDDCSNLTYEDMDGIIIGTPHGEAVQAIHHLQIPWFRFQTLIEPYFDKMRRGDSRLALSNPSVSIVSDIVQIEPLVEVLRLLAGCTSTATEINDIYKTLYYHLEDISIEMRDHECADYVVQGGDPSKLEQMSLFIRYFVYLSSNNLLNHEKTDKIVEWMVKSETQWVLDLLLDLRTPTTEIFGCSIFVSAVKLGQIDVVRDLIARGVDVDASAGDFFRRTALEEAVRYRHPRVVELLTNAGARLHSQVQPDHSLLYAALDWSSEKEMLKMLVNKGADVNAVQDDSGHPRSLLALVVGRSNHEMTRLLLEAGARIDAFEDSGTALQVAVVREDVEAVQLLIDAGADIDAPAGDEYDAGNIGQNYQWLRTPIQEASLAGNAEIVQILVNRGADVNAFKWEGYYNDSSWEVYRRHQWKSYVNFEDTAAYRDILITPLQAAVFRRNPALVRILLEAGAHVDEAAYGDTPFQMAAALEEAKIMQILWRHGADVNAPAADNDGMTALQAAARAGNYKLAQDMLVSGSEVNAAASPCGGRTALQAAAESGNVNLAKILIEVGANVNAVASPINGRTCLQAAAEKGHVEMVLMLLKEGADVNGSAATISGGLTALQAALCQLNCEDEVPDIEDDDEGLDVEDDDEETGVNNNYKAPDVRKTKQSRDTILQALFDAGAELGALSSPYEGMTGFLGAVLSGRTDLVRRGLLRGADPNIAVEGMTALGAAVVQGSDELVILLLKGGADVNAHCEVYYPVFVPDERALWTALHIAAKTGRIEIANLLLQAGAEIHMPLLHRGSPTVLQSAIAGKNVTMVQFLLNKGADPNAYGARETSGIPLAGPVHMEILNTLAVAGGDFNRIVDVYELAFSKEVMQKALDSGALTHWTAEQKGHLLQAGIKQGYFDLIQGMLDAGADVNTPAALYYGRTALQKAAGIGCSDIVMLLLSYGADVNAPAGKIYGRTALQRAAEEGRTNIVTLLVSNGADVNAPAGYRGGITALQGAALNGNLKIALVLLRAGADINAAPAVKRGRTALQAAAEHGRLDIVSLLLGNDHDTEGMELRCESAATFAERRGHKVIARILREHKAGQGTTG